MSGSQSVRKVKRGRPAREMTSYALRRVYELQGAYLRLGSPDVRAEARRRRSECLSELHSRGETIYANSVTLPPSRPEIGYTSDRK